MSHRLDGLYISHNGGMRWTRAGGLPAGPVLNVAIAPFRPGTVYAIAGNLVFKSSDRGARWSSTGQPAGSVLVTDLHEDWMLYATGVSGAANLGEEFRWRQHVDAGRDRRYGCATVRRYRHHHGEPAVARSECPDVLYAVARTDVTFGGTTTSYDKVFKSFTGGA
jgi:hypothetical protein